MGLKANLIRRILSYWLDSTHYPHFRKLQGKKQLLLAASPPPPWYSKNFSFLLFSFCWFWHFHPVRWVLHFYFRQMRLNPDALCYDHPTNCLFISRNSIGLQIWISCESFWRLIAGLKEKCSNIDVAWQILIFLLIPRLVSQSRRYRIPCLLSPLDFISCEKINFFFSFFFYPCFLNVDHRWITGLLIHPPI